MFRNIERILPAFVVLSALALAASEVRARPRTVEFATEAAQNQQEPALLERFNRTMFDVNAKLGEWTSQLGDASGLTNSAAATGMARMVFNAVNEPVAAMSHLATLDFDKAWSQTKRFAINTTTGWLGFRDPATAQGIKPEIQDFGVALCRYGVPEGPYVVMPILGSRTLRDAAADIVLANLAVLVLMSPFVSAGLLSVEAAVAIAILDEGIVLAIAREMDPEAKLVDTGEYETTRVRYLEMRRKLCPVTADAR